MKSAPHITQLDIQVEIYRQDLDEFTALTRAKERPEWLPANYRITGIEDTHGKPATEPTMIVRVRMQFVGQTKV